MISPSHTSLCSSRATHRPQPHTICSRGIHSLPSSPASGASLARHGPLRLIFLKFCHPTKTTASHCASPTSPRAVQAASLAGHSSRASVWSIRAACRLWPSHNTGPKMLTRSIASRMHTACNATHRGPGWRCGKSMEEMRITHRFSSPASSALDSLCSKGGGRARRHFPSL